MNPMSMLVAFAAMSMCMTALLSMLPEGGLRRAAMLSACLLLAAMWLETLPQWLHPMEGEGQGGSWLAPVAGMDIAQRQNEMASRMQEGTGRE